MAVGGTRGCALALPALLVEGELLFVMNICKMEVILYLTQNNILQFMGKCLLFYIAVSTK